MIVHGYNMSSIGGHSHGKRQTTMCGNCGIGETACSDPSGINCGDCIRIMREAIDAFIRSEKCGNANVSSITITEVEPMTTDIKAILLKSIKQGAATGTMKAVSKEMTRAIAEHYPEVMMLPQDIRHVVICCMFNAVAAAAPQLPGAAATESFTGLALEGLATTTVSNLVESLVGKIGPSMLRIAELSKGKTKQIKCGDEE